MSQQTGQSLPIQPLGHDLRQARRYGSLGSAERRNTFQELPFRIPSYKLKFAADGDGNLQLTGWETNGLPCYAFSDHKGEMEIVDSHGGSEVDKENGIEGMSHVSPEACNALKSANKQFEKILRDHLPPYVFEADARTPLNDKDNQKKRDTHSILDVQVSSAIRDAALDVYLSYCDTIDAKQSFLEKFNELKDIVFENTIVRSCQEEAASFTRKSDAYHVAEMFVRQDILKSQSMSGSHKETGDKGKGRA